MLRPRRLVELLGPVGNRDRSLRQRWCREYPQLGRLLFAGASIGLNLVLGAGWQVFRRLRFGVLYGGVSQNMSEFLGSTKGVRRVGICG